MPVPLTCSEQNIRANRLYHDHIAAKYGHDPRVRLGTMHSNCSKRLTWLKNRYEILRSSSIALNLGVGTGNLMKKAEELFGYVIGMDISINMLQQAKHYSHNLVQGNALDIPLKSQSVQLVFCIALLHHIYDLECFFQSVYRILKPGGIFYSDYDPNRRFFQTIQNVPLFSFLMTLYKKISDTFIFTKRDGATWKSVRDMAEYHEEIRHGLEPDEISKIAQNAGFSQVAWLCHNDSPNLDYPRKGRWIHNTVDKLLSVFSKNYNDRAKIFSLIAVK